MNDITPPARPIGPPPRLPATSPSDPAGTARDFEAVFLGQMARVMLESVEMGEQFSGGHGEQMFRGILAENLGTEMARQGGIGLAPAVMEQIIRMQGDSNGGQ